MSTPQNALSPPPRRISFRLRNFVRYDSLDDGHAWSELLLALLFCFFLFLPGANRFIDRHQKGWEPIESKGTVKSYSPQHFQIDLPWYMRSGLVPGYQCYELVYTFKDDEGNECQKSSYKYVPSSSQDDKSFQKGEIVTVEKYKYEEFDYRVSKTQAHHNDWSFWMFLVLIPLVLWLPVYRARRKLWFLRNGQTATARLEKSETVSKKRRQDIYQFSVEEQTLNKTRTVSQPEKNAALEETTVFYDPANPQKSMLLVDINPFLAIADNRIEITKMSTYVLGSTLYPLLVTPVFLGLLALYLVAPYLPF